MIGFAVLCAFVVVLLTPVVNWYLEVLKYRKLRGIPGPKPWPVIGNSNLLGKTPGDYLQALLRLQKRYGNFYKLWTGPTLRIVINKPQYLEELLTSNINLSKSNGYDLFKPWLGDGLLVSTGIKWKQRRKMITPTFHFKVLEDFMQIFNYQIDIMLDKMNDVVQGAPGQTIDIFKYINLMSLDIICETAFGTPIGAQSQENPKYVEAVKTFLEIFVFRFFSGWMGHPLFFRFSEPYKIYYQTLNTLHVFTEKVIQKRKAEFAKKGKMTGIREDGVKIRSALLDMLLEANQNGGNLSDEDIRDEVNTFMFEGHDTSATAMCFTLYALAQNPHCQDKIYEEFCEVLGEDPKVEVTLSQINDLKYMDIVVKEALRVYQPVPLIERNIDEDWTVDGITIPKNTTVAIFLYGMSHDPAVFPDPDKFDPDRFLGEKLDQRHNYSYIPFSAGPRNCIGQRYAMYSLKACVAKFLLQFRVVEDPNFKMEIGTCSVLKSMNGYKMKIQRRKPAGK
ncbi:cytochrome P450 4d2-like [Anthonomus grandis grandis]|uniref:cytochrome P450 4d2-like n=1 Tax=Anthonomus grandis grandis TaxID=2921223 RepID=UPI0021659FB0|nr:cytochrome P450 4d2-like [Anthonomus grandis grandis]